MSEDQERTPVDSTTGRDELLLPEGTLLVHIGPHKTGTTSLQAALFDAREAMLAQGVRHAGRSRNPASAVMAATGRPSPFTGGGVPSIRRWHDLMREISKAREPRVLVSSEFFADADPDAIRRVVHDLGPERVHVVVTLRPLTKIITSQWQQYVQGGQRTSFDAWLDAMLRGPGKLSPTFWHRHRHDQLIARWAEVVGTDRMTVVVVDERDHEMVLRVFERLLGLRTGTLVAVSDMSNRSMTLPEVEVVRAFNIAFHNEKLGKPLYTKVMRQGAAQYMKAFAPDPDAARVEAPQWALDRSGEIAREMVDNIVASGVRVVGDLEALTQVPVSGRVGDAEPVVVVTPQVAATAAMGVLVASGLARDQTGQTRVARKGTEDARPEIEPPEVHRVPTYVLAGVIVGRTRVVVTRRLRSLFRRRR